VPGRVRACAYALRGVSMKDKKAVLYGCALLAYLATVFAGVLMYEMRMRR